MKRGTLARLWKSLKPLRRNERGNVLILTAMGLPILIGGAGLGVDTTQWYLWKRELQTAVDAAALSGAFSAAQGFSHASSAEQELARNIDVVTIKGRSVALGDWDGGTGNAVTVSANTQRTLPFSSMFLNAAPTISAAATAASLNDGEHCMIALDDGTQTTMTVEGNALLQLNCGIGARGRGTAAVKFDGKAQVAASPISAVGGITAEDKNLMGDSTIRPYSLAPKDPFEGMAVPTNPTARTYDPTSSTLQPGTYSDLTLANSADLAPGVYVIDGGCLCANAKERLTGDGVTIVLKGGATVGINGSALVDLSAPTSGSYKGILIFEDKSSAVGTKTSTINGNTNLKLEGAIYTPTQHFQINGNSAPTTECLLLAAKTIYVGGNTAIKNTCGAGYDHPGDNGAKVVRLVK